MKFPRQLLILLFLLALPAATLPAQMAPTGGIDSSGTVGPDFYNNLYFAVGMHASLVSGAGLAGRVSLPKGYTFQLASFVITAGDYTHFNVGAEAQYAFIRDMDGRFYSLFGMGFYTSSDKKQPERSNVIADPFRMELGLGYEYFTSRNFVISLSFGVQYFAATSKVYPLPQFGMFFYFR
jgi:hypothetical protein